MADGEMMTTLAVGEEDGTPDNPDLCDLESWLKPGKGHGGKGHDGWATTMAIGEEGDPDPWPGEVTTMAIGEEGDCWVLEPEPIMTTMALGEEGGEPWDISM